MINFTIDPFIYKQLIFKYMSGFFGTISKTSCIEDVFYGTDYHSHLGLKGQVWSLLYPEKDFADLYTILKMLISETNLKMN